MRADRATQFMKNYVIAMWRYWNAIPSSVRDELRRDQNYSRVFQILEPYYSQAAGRLKILNRMIAMRRGDIVFLPNVPNAGESFSVARIDDAQYTFEDRAKPDPGAFWEVDFGHRRRVRDVRKFEYGAKTLTPSVFGSPYRHAIDKVSARESQFRAFIELHYQE